MTWRTMLFVVLATGTIAELQALLVSANRRQAAIFEQNPDVHLSA